MEKEQSTAAQASAGTVEPATELSEDTDAPTGPESSPPTTDAELESIISAILLGDPRTANAELGVDVSASIAVLTGKTESDEQGKVAELLARTVPGVTRVENYTVVSEPRVARPERLRGDAAILAQMQERLGVVSPIVVSVDERVVTLSGIANEEEIQYATAIAWAAGARKVIDQTRLVPLEITPL